MLLVFLILYLIALSGCSSDSRVTLIHLEYKTCGSDIDVDRDVEISATLSGLTVIRNAACSVLNEGRTCSDNKLNLRYSIQCIDRYVDVFKEVVEVLSSNKRNISSATRSHRRKRFDFSDPTDGGSTSDCDEGYQEINNGCVECPKGLYESEGICTKCPYNSYSERSGSTSCVSCPDALKTVHNASTDIADCTVICVLPTANRNKFYVDDVLRSAGDRIGANTIVSFECVDNLYYRGVTYMKFRCSEKLELPSICYDVQMTTTEMYGIKDEHVTLTCDVKYDPGANNIRWFRDGRMVKQTHTDNRVNNFTLIVNETGIYSCKVEIDGYWQPSSVNSKVTFIELTLNQWPSVVIDKGTALTIECAATYISDLPYTYLTWYLGNVAYRSGIEKSANATYFISKLTTWNTEGVFTCEASYVDSQYVVKASVIKAQTTVYVRDFIIEPKFYFGSNTINMIRLNSSITLTCSLRGDDHKIGLSWYRDSVAMTGYSASYKNKTTTSLLRIDNASVEDSGVYTCRFRESFSSVELRVTEFKVNLVSLRETNYLQGERVTFTCIVDSPGIVRWRKGGVNAVLQESDSAQMWSDINSTITTGYLVLGSLSLDDTGTYYCEGFYIEYLSDISSENRLLLSVRALQTSMSSQHSIVGGPTVMTCIVNGAPDIPNVTWSHSGAQSDYWSGLVMTSELTVRNISKDLNISCSASIRGYNSSVTAVLELIGLNIHPGGVIRSFVDNDLTLTCVYIESFIFDGTFIWEKNGRECNECVQVSDPTKSVIKIKAEDSVWKCRFRKEIGGYMKSMNSVIKTIARKGSLTPSLNWSPLYSSSLLTCTVPLTPSNKALPQILWSVDNVTIEHGYIFTKDGIPLKVVKQTDQSTTNDTVTQIVHYMHDIGGAGNVRCTAVYNADNINVITEPISVRNSVVRGPNTIIIYPGIITKVKFITETHSTPHTSLSLSTVNNTSSLSALYGGVKKVEIFSIVYEEHNFSSVYNYSVVSDNFTAVLSGRVIVLGVTGIEESVYSTVNGSVLLKVWVVCREEDELTIYWYKDGDIIESGDVISLVGELHSGRRQFSLLFDRVSVHDFALYKASITFNNSATVTTRNCTLKQILLTVANTSYVGFAREDVTMSVGVKGPEVKEALLISNESKDKVEARLSGEFYKATLSSLNYHHHGSYYFTVLFVNGKKAVSRDITLDVRIMCKPLPIPSNTILIQEKDSFNNVVIRRECKSTTYYSNTVSTALCNTRLGRWNTTELLPCYKLINNTEHNNDTDIED